MPSFRIRQLSEDEIEALIIKLEGKRAHPDADKRGLEGADFVLGSSVIELKILEDERLDKLGPQQKLAELFRKRFPQRPTIVLDRDLLDAEGQQEYNNIVEASVKTAVKKASQQLKQSRLEHEAKTTMLWVINNGCSSLDHEVLMELVVRRARNDSSSIDAVVVSGIRFHSDGFDGEFIWPMDCTSIHLDKPFEEFKTLRDAWNKLAEDRMTELVRGSVAIGETKGPIVDLSFKWDGITYVVPAPPMGCNSDFFVKGRPRNDSTGITMGITPPPRVATVFAGLSRSEWTQFKRCKPLPDSFVDFCDYSEWVALDACARSESQLKPFITIPVTCASWKKWKRQLPRGANSSIHDYANDLFHERLWSIIHSRRERTDKSILPHRYMLLITEEIGQDLAFDVSHLYEVCIPLDGNERFEEVLANKPMFFEQALTVAAAEAIARGVEYVFWEKDKTYAWS